jgi:hypothetical protein
LDERISAIAIIIIRANFAEFSERLLRFGGENRGIISAGRRDGCSLPKRPRSVGEVSMLMVDRPVIRQRLFSAKTAEGTKLYLAFLSDGGCAILREGEVVQAWGDEPESLDRALDRFLELMRDELEKR